MLVKKYVVKDMPEALTKIRQDLGPDAVILSSKKIKQKGFLGFFSMTLLEVVAAVNDAEPVSHNAVRQNTAASARQKPTQPKPIQPANAPAHQSKPITAQATVKPQSAVKSGPTAAAQGVSSDSQKEVLKEVQELRSILSNFLNTNSAALPGSIVKVRSELVDNDVSPEFAEKLILKAIEKNDENHLLEEQEFRQLLTDLISEEINGTLIGSPIAAESRVVAFVGPTGVGKTTSIAKIAAAEFLKNKRKVGLITADTYRIAAVEQLKTYASILQLPIEIVFSTDEIGSALKKLKQCDLVLIDTAGRNYGDTVLVDELNGFLQAADPDETYLVLSMTTKSSDMERIVANFDGVPIDKLIFTKLDETSSYGAMYNLTCKYQKPLAYLTTGQNVPDDIEVATPHKIATLVVGEQQYV